MEPQKIKIISYLGLSFCILTFTFCIFVNKTSAIGASLYLSPSSGTYTVGNTFSVQIKVNSGGVAINTSEGTLVFNPDKLEVKSISKTDSIFTLWVQEPAFSNSLGTITFAGGKPSPGYTGAAGTINTITFKAKTATFATADLTFAVGSVLADDGKGTNVLTNMGSGVYTLVARETGTIPQTPSEEGETAPSGVSGQTPAAPVVSSLTHPDETKWYSDNDPEFTWQLPSDVTGVSLLLHQKADANPGLTSDGLVTSKNYEDIGDGIWYFHIRFRNQYGWGDILHRKVSIDTENPDPFKITIDNEGNSTNPAPIIYFETTDSLSGIDYYEVKIGDQIPSTTQASTILAPFRPGVVPAGKNTIEIKAFDKAGNFALASADLEINSIGTPKITKIPKSIRIGDVLTIEGEAEPEIGVRIYIQMTDKEPIFEKVSANLTGKFVLNYEKVLAKGDYVVWAQAEDERGALSSPTKKYSLEVGLPPFLKFGKMALDYLTTMITLIILIVGAIAVIFYTWYRVSMWRKKVSKETKEVSQSVSGSFRALRDEVEEQISMLDKKPGLTKGEKEIRDKLQEALDISEKFIAKEIKDVEKELE